MGCGPYERMECRIYSAGFRCVRQHKAVSKEFGEDALDWDLKDDHGNPVGNGLYYANFSLTFQGQVETYTCKIMVLR